MDAKSFDTTRSRDAISWLPDEVQGKILSLLPTKQAASTSVLSKKWRNVFRLVDNLHFDDSASGEDKLERDVLPERDRKFLEIIGYVPERFELLGYMFPESFKNFVDRTLALQCGYPIKKFSLKCHIGAGNDCQKACVNRWISNVVERGVLELELRIIDRAEHFIPPQLFASKTLVKLTLGRKLCLGKLPSDVSLPSLKTLFIDTIFFEMDDLCCVLLAGCPVLEELSIHHYAYAGTPLDISSPTVKRLSVYYYGCDDRRHRSYMLLNLPNLVYFDYSDHALAEYPQVNLESLVEAKLGLFEVDKKYWRPNVTELFLGLRNVEILHLSPTSVDVIYSYFSHQLPVFNNLVKLSIGSNKNEKSWRLLPYLLEKSPKLETLIIQDLNGYTCDEVSMPRNKVKELHILDFCGTEEELKQLESYVLGFRCLELVQVVTCGRVVHVCKPKGSASWSSNEFVSVDEE